MNVIFDIGRVLIDFDWDGFVGRYLEPEAAAEVTEAMWHNPDWIEFDRGVLTDEQVLKLFIAKAPWREREIRLIFSRLGEIPRKREGAIPLIEQLKSEGHRVFFLSNYFEYLMHVAPEPLDFLSHMEGGVFSCFEHLVKPDREIFQLICERYSLVPAECVFIDDTEKNVRAAESLGMKGVHFKNMELDELYTIISHFQELEKGQR